MYSEPQTLNPQQLQIGQWPNAVPTPEHGAHLIKRWQRKGSEGDAGELRVAPEMDMFQFGVWGPHPPAFGVSLSLM